MLRRSGLKLKVLRFLRQHAQLAEAMQRKETRPANYSRIRTENTSTDQRFRGSTFEPELYWIENDDEVYDTIWYMQISR